MTACLKAEQVPYLPMSMRKMCSDNTCWLVWHLEDHGRWADAISDHWKFKLECFGTFIAFQSRWASKATSNSSAYQATHRHLPWWCTLCLLDENQPDAPCWAACQNEDDYTLKIASVIMEEQDLRHSISVYSWSCLPRCRELEFLFVMFSITLPLLL